MSGDDQPTHHRLIVEFCHGFIDARTLRVVAELASHLDLDLYGLFTEDAAILDLAKLSFARELRLPAHEWQPMEPDRLAAELRHAAADAQRLLRDVADALGVPNAFEVRRGDPAATIAAVASRRDVLALMEPAGMHAGLSPALSRMLAAAQYTAASLLLLPQTVIPRAGPVAALVIGPDDASLPIAARAAISTGEALLLLLPASMSETAGAVASRAVALGVPRRRVLIRMLDQARPEDLLHALAHERERLLVLARASLAGDVTAAARVAAQRRIPVLLVGPDSTY